MLLARAGRTAGVSPSPAWGGHPLTSVLLGEGTACSGGTSPRGPGRTVLAAPAQQSHWVLPGLPHTAPEVIRTIAGPANSALTWILPTHKMNVWEFLSSQKTRKEKKKKNYVPLTPTYPYSPPHFSAPPKTFLYFLSPFLPTPLSLEPTPISLSSLLHQNCPCPDMTF